MAPLIVALVLAALAILVVASSIRIVRQARVGVVERWGKYRASLTPGLHVIIPMLDRITAVVDMRETVQAFAPQPVITQDNVTIGIDIVVYYQVTDPFRATYEVANVLVAMEQQSNILRAEGEKKARALRAEGEAEALTKIFQMVKDTGTQPSDMLGYKYLEALPSVAAGDANKLLLLPTGAADAMGAVAGLGAAFSEGSAAVRQERKRPSPPARPEPPETPEA